MSGATAAGGRPGGAPYGRTGAAHVPRSAAADGGARADAIRSIIGDVVAAAVDAAHASGVIVLRDWTPEGELAYEWLVTALGESRVWRGASLASNVHVQDREDAQMLAAWRFSREHGAMIADPSSKTALLLGGPLPLADMFPLGDLHASQVAELAGGWSVPDGVRPIVEQVGVAALDAALMRLVEAREAPDLAFAGIDRAVAEELLALYARGRSGRLRRWLVPKLTARTLGIDLFD